MGEGGLEYQIKLKSSLLIRFAESSVRCQGAQEVFFCIDLYGFAFYSRDCLTPAN